MPTPANDDPRAGLLPGPPTAPATLGNTVRVGFYLQAPTLNEAKSAYLIDLDTAATTPGNFAIWIAQVIAGHAALTPEQRAARAHALPPQTTTGEGVNRPYAIDEAVIEAMNTAITADRAAGRFLSRSEFVTEAIRLATESARNRAGGTLPPPPRRLPNNPVR